MYEAFVWPFVILRRTNIVLHSASHSSSQPMSGRIRIPLCTEQMFLNWPTPKRWYITTVGSIIAEVCKNKSGPVSTSLVLGHFAMNEYNATKFYILAVAVIWQIFINRFDISNALKLFYLAENPVFVTYWNMLTIWKRGKDPKNIPVRDLGDSVAWETFNTKPVKFCLTKFSFFTTIHNVAVLYRDIKRVFLSFDC